MFYYVCEVKMIMFIGDGKFMFSEWLIFYMLGGWKDKIFKGDIVGLFFKEGGLKLD